MIPVLPPKHFEPHWIRQLRARTFRGRHIVSVDFWRSTYQRVWKLFSAASLKPRAPIALACCLLYFLRCSTTTTAGSPCLCSRVWRCDNSLTFTKSAIVFYQSLNTQADQLPNCIMHETDWELCSLPLRASLVLMPTWLCMTWPRPTTPAMAGT
ncbi:hypothetical protein D3C80_1102080 [compost metagenome]